MTKFDNELPLEHGLFGRLRRDAGAVWEGYVGHRFVRALGRGTLPEPAFAHYLKQDYLFLLQFARAYSLAGYKSSSLADLRSATASVNAIIDEMPLHVSFCRGWGLDEAAMQAEPEALETLAYTRFVLERGMAGDRLDLDVALAPCVVGYAEVARLLLADPAGVDANNRYRPWIETYAADGYQAVAARAIEGLDRRGAERGAEARYAELLATFTAATRLETAFWEMGWRAGQGEAGQGVLDQRA